MLREIQHRRTNHWIALQNLLADVQRRGTSAWPQPWPDHKVSSRVLSSGRSLQVWRPLSTVSRMELRCLESSGGADTWRDIQSWARGWVKKSVNSSMYSQERYNGHFSVSSSQVWYVARM